MNLDMLDSTVMLKHAAQTAAEARLSRVTESGGDSFAAELGKARAQAQQQAREASEQLVASTLLLPLLQQMRNDPFKTDMFHGGSAEDIFGAQLDTQLADRMASSMRLPVVEQVYERITRQLDARMTAGRTNETGGIDSTGRIDRHG